MDRVERVVQLAERGELTNLDLAHLLPSARRQEFLEACATIERRYTTACAEAGDPCLASGCSMDREAGEVCLQPTLNAGAEYYKACAAAWRRLASAATLAAN